MSKYFQEVLEEELNLVAKAILNQVMSSQIIFFTGDPGAGKTTLINVLLKQLRMESSASPTFSLHNRITSANHKIDHFDLYRIDHVDELETTGIWDVVSECQATISSDFSHLIFIEWANKFDSSIWPINLPQLTVKISNGSQNHSRMYQIF